MSRRKKGESVHGWVVLDKPIGMTSTQAVGVVRRLFNARKAGHAGTLDPLATGVLPIALGEATKTVRYAVEGEKAYRFTVRWGIETRTDDTEGEVVQTSEQRPTRAEIERAIPHFVGEILQTPPAFSAVKVNGERAYDLARDGEEVVLEPRLVVIDELRLTDAGDRDTATFEARCGKGTYVRALARDLGRTFGCFGHVIALRRTQVGCFTEDMSVTLDTIRSAADDACGPGPSEYLLPIEAALGELVELNVSPSDAADLLQGRSILIRGRDAPPVIHAHAYAVSKGRIVALGEIEKGALHPTRVFNLGS
jgi:tRNA pseudouridine55 synthase